MTDDNRESTSFQGATLMTEVLFFRGIYTSFLGWAEKDLRLIVTLHWLWPSGEKSLEAEV